MHPFAEDLQQFKVGACGVGEDSGCRLDAIQLIEKHQSTQVHQIFFVSSGPRSERPARIFAQGDEDVCDHQRIGLLVEALDRRLDGAGDLDL